MEKSKLKIKVAEKKRASKQSRAGLTLPVPRVRRAMGSRLMRGDYLSDSAAVAMTAAVEYLVQELLELGGNDAIARHKKFVSPAMLARAIHGDPVLDAAFDRFIVVGGTPRATLPPKAPRDKTKVAK